MLRQFNYANHGVTGHRSGDKYDVKGLFDTNKREFLEKQKNLLTGIGTDKMDDTDFFLTLLLKNLTANERFMLLNKLLNIDWDNPDDSLENHITELINKKKDDEELKKTLEYEYFLWDFKNWKNYFLSHEKE